MENEEQNKKVETEMPETPETEEGAGSAADAKAETKLSFGRFLMTSKKKGKKLGLDRKTLFWLDVKEWVVSLVSAFVAVMLLITFVVRVITVEGHSMDSTLASGEKLFVTAYDVRFGSAPARGDVVICHYPGRTNLWPAENFGVRIKTDFVKRVVGLPGDTIRRINGVTFVNGIPLDLSIWGVNWTLSVAEDGSVSYYYNDAEVEMDLDKLEGAWTYKKADDGSIRYFHNGEQIELSDKQTYRYKFDYTYTLKENEYFVVGDNRYESHDSRAWNGPDLPYEQTNNASGHVGPIIKDMIIGHVRSVFFPFGNARNVPNDANYLDPSDRKAEASGQ